MAAIEFRIGMKDSALPDQQVQEMLVVGKKYPGFGVYTALSIEIHGDGSQTPYYVFGLGGESKRVRAEDILESL